MFIIPFNLRALEVNLRVFNYDYKMLGIRKPVNPQIVQDKRFV